jgi:hypothetical protein
MVAAEARRIRLGELLLRAGVITEDQLRTALAEQKKWGGKLGSLLVELNFLDEDLLVKALSKQLSLPRVDFSGLVIPRQALEKIDPDFASQRQVLPISLDIGKGVLVIAMADPDNLGLVDELAFRSGCRIKVAIAGERSLAHAIREYYYGDNVAAPVLPGDDEMKLITPLGNTMVRRLDDIKAQSQPSALADAPAPPVASAPPMTIEERLKRLEALQQKEVRILKTMVEMLISKGFITREEYRQGVE